MSSRRPVIYQWPVHKEPISTGGKKLQSEPRAGPLRAKFGLLAT